MKKIETRPDLGTWMETLISSKVRMAINHAEAMESVGTPDQVENAKQTAYDWINFQCEPLVPKVRVRVKDKEEK